MLKLQKNIDGSARLTALMGGLLLTVSEALSADLSKSIEFERKGKTTIPFTPELAKKFGRLTGDEILLMEECLDELGSHFGYGIDFKVSKGMHIRILALPPEDDKPPIDDDDDQPVQEIENADVVEAVSDKPKAMAARA